MGKSIYYLMIAVMLATFFAVVSCQQEDARTTEEGGEKPLLLLTEGDAAEEPDGPVADNSRCFVCHMNYEEDKLTLVHAKAEIGCEQCHGSSDAHCSDEDNITPPETMYAKEKIVSFCMGCHSTDKMPTRPHKKILAGAATEKKYCIDCHGKHSLAHRTRRWDKTTGELIADDKVRMMTEDMLKKQ